MGTNRTNKKMKSIYTTAEVSKVLKLKPTDLKKLEKEGFFEFADRERTRVDSRNLAKLKVVMSLKRELGVNDPGVEVILNMRDKMTKMQREFNIFLLFMKKHLGRRLEKNFEELSKRL